MARTFGLLILALAVFASARAHAQARRVVVEVFGGPRGAAVRADVIRSFEENGIEIVPDEEVRAARERLSIDRLSEPEQYVALGRELSAHAFVDGRVRRARRSWSATVRVRNAQDGAELGDASWGGRTASSLNGVRRNAFARLSEHLNATTAPQAQPRRPPRAQVVLPDEIENERPPGDEPEPEPAPDPEPAPSSDTRYDAFRIALVGGTLFRWMNTPVSVYAAQRGTASCRVNADPASETCEETRVYQSGGIGHFELGGLAEVYPGAFGDQPFPYLGLVLALTHSIGVVTVAPDSTTGSAFGVATNQLDFYAGLRGRYRFGADRREPEIRIDLGWGLFHFNLDLAQLAMIQRQSLVPPMQHGYVHLALGASYGLIPTYLTVGIDVGYNIGTNTGGETRNVWGSETGPSNGLVLGLEIKTEIPEIVRGAFVALRFSYFQFTTNFEGQVGFADPDDSGYMDPWSDPRLWEPWPVTPPPAGTNADVNDVIGGPTGDVNDNYFRLQLAIGYAFRD
jgi:hypothetical protein